MLASSAVLVAVVAGRRSVHEVRYAGVLVDGYCLRMSGGGVAVDARKTGIVCGHLVAVVANRPVMGNREICVVERGSQPTARRMAAIAGGRISRGDVVRNGAAQRLRAVPLRLMTAVTSGIRRSERIVVVDVTVRAGLHATRRGHNVPAG